MTSGQATGDDHWSPLLGLLPTIQFDWVPNVTSPIHDRRQVSRLPQVSRTRQPCGAVHRTPRHRTHVHRRDGTCAPSGAARFPAAARDRERHLPGPAVGVPHRDCCWKCLQRMTSRDRSVAVDVPRRDHLGSRLRLHRERLPPDLGGPRRHRHRCDHRRDPAADAHRLGGDPRPRRGQRLRLLLSGSAGDRSCGCCTGRCSPTGSARSHPRSPHRHSRSPTSSSRPPSPRSPRTGSASPTTSMPSLPSCRCSSCGARFARRAGRSSRRWIRPPR